ncbi:MAG: DinB family protein [Candidatus Electryonea clarkiae]|nr:DinB family protein [Candidatus Electryonea clarkiae]MDP8287505.1 DinB family protein [Candidatus Electryonea clarkiae]
MLWIERDFDLNIPSGLFPSLLERLRGTPVRLENLVASLSPDILKEKPGNNSWSIQENAGHLLAVEILWSTRIEDFKKKKEVLMAADMENKKTKKADYNKQDINNIISDFHKVRSELVVSLESLDDETIRHSSLHPRLNKQMTVPGLMYFIAEHDDHHLARISEVSR